MVPAVTIVPRGQKHNFLNIDLIQEGFEIGSLDSLHYHYQIALLSLHYHFQDHFLPFPCELVVYIKLRPLLYRF